MSTSAAPAGGTVSAGEPPSLSSDPSAASFYIPASASFLQRRPRTLKQGDTFGVFDHHGDITADGGPEGLYHRDCRYLSQLRLFANGELPLLLSSTVQDNNVVLTADLTNPDFFVGTRLVLRRDSIYIVRSKLIWQAVCYERLAIRNFDGEPQTVELAFRYSADFADIFEVRGHQRPRRGRLETVVGDRRVSFVYHGLDGVRRRTVLRFDCEPEILEAGFAIFRLQVPPGGSTALFLAVSCHDGDDAEAPDPRRFLVSLYAARKRRRRKTSAVAAIETSHQIFDEVIRRGSVDLAMLVADTPHGPYPYAGIPWFSTAFGRDAIITAIEMLWVDPTLARGVLDYLAVMQARDTVPEADAEPGKILHETRSGEMARLGEVPFARYYGSVDSTPLYVLLAGLYFDRTGDRETVARLWPNIEAALGWIDAFGDRDGDGFVEYQRNRESGLVNQGWKDSSDAIFHADGTLVEGAIALCEVQAYVFAARQAAARIAAAIGLPDRARELREQAEALRLRFEEAFWCEEIGSYVLALDGRKRPCKVRASNAGHALFCGIASPERAARVAAQLMGREFFTGWGIRTVASVEKRYNPMSYHNGSIWPHDNALIALGFARYGFSEHALRLFTGICDAAAYMDLRRLPELYCGFRRRPDKAPTLYPVACAPQAWAAAAPFALLQACLGIDLGCMSERVRLRRPRLPEFLERVTVRSLAAGGGRIDLLMRRYDVDVAVNVLRSEGEVEVEVTL